MKSRKYVLCKKKKKIYNRIPKNAYDVAGMCKSIQVRSNMNGHYMLLHVCVKEKCV